MKATNKLQMPKFLSNHGLNIFILCLTKFDTKKHQTSCKNYYGFHLIFFKLQLQTIQNVGICEIFQ